MTVLSKQQRQVNRLPKNQTKSTRLCIKQACNDEIKRYAKNKSMSPNVKAHLTAMTKRFKADFTN